MAVMFLDVTKFKLDDVLIGRSRLYRFEILALGRTYQTFRRQYLIKVYQLYIPNQDYICPRFEDCSKFQLEDVLIGRGCGRTQQTDLRYLDVNICGRQYHADSKFEVEDVPTEWC